MIRTKRFLAMTLGMTFFLWGCATPKKYTEIKKTNAGIQCAEGHHLRGDPPPVGNEQWCRDAKGINQGPWMLWHKNKQLAATGNFRNGLFQGALNIFDISGQPMQKLKLLDGKLQGPFTVYWPHGPLCLEGEHYRNVKKGPFIYYDTTGVERKRVISPTRDPNENNENEEEGQINISQIKASIHAANLAIEQCYETFLRQDRNIRGTAQLVFWIDKKGYADKIRYENNQITSMPLLLCVENAVSRSRFPKARNAPVTIEIPLRFSPHADFEN